MGSYGTILQTRDGGTTWVAQDSGTTKTLYGVSFTDANTGTAVGNDGTILRTTRTRAVVTDGREQVGRTPYLYYTRHNGWAWLAISSVCR